MGKVNFYVLFVLMGITFRLFAQQGNCDIIVPKKAQKQYQKLLAEYQSPQKSSKETMDKFKDLADKYPDFLDVYVLLADHYKNGAFRTPRHKPNREKMMQEALRYYKIVEERCPGHAGHLAYYHQGIIYHKNYHDEKIAAEYFKKYLDNELEPPKSYKRVAQDLKDFYFLKYDLLKNPVPYDPKPVKGVNTEKDEFLPMLSPDNNFLYFSRKMLFNEQKLGAINVQEKYDYFIQSRKMDVDSFTLGLPMANPFNQFTELLDKQNLVSQGGVCLTPDNKEMYVTVTLNDPSISSTNRNTQIYVAKIKDGSWQQLKSIGNHINDEANEPTWEGQPTISSDGKMMIFASARPSSTSYETSGGTISSMDLYMVKRMNNGQWTKPESLGPVINTPGNEKTPFLHSDSKTLYFASNGHPGMGGYDMYYTKMDENGYWSKPINLGYPINDEKDNHGLIVSLDGAQAFLASGTPGDGIRGLDLIHFPLHEKVRPEKVVFMKGTLKDEKGKPVKNGKIQIKDPQTGEVTEALVDPDNGEYVAVLSISDPEREQPPKATVILEFAGEEVEVDYGSKVAQVNGVEKIIPPGARIVDLEDKQIIAHKGDRVLKVNGVPTLVKKGFEVVDSDKGQKIVALADVKKETKQQFLVTASGDDMVFTTQVIEENPKDIAGAKTVRGKEIEIQRAEKGQVIRLNEVNFATNSYFLNSVSMSVIDELKAYLEQKPSMKIAIHGHTDNVGNAELNLTLSKSRAQEVMVYLISLGIDAQRLSFEGFGQTQPKSSNATKAGRALNRRVEFVILEL